MECQSRMVFILFRNRVVHRTEFSTAIVTKYSHVQYIGFAALNDDESGEVVQIHAKNHIRHGPLKAFVQGYAEVIQVQKDFVMPSEVEILYGELKKNGRPPTKKRRSAPGDTPHITNNTTNNTTNINNITNNIQVNVNNIHFHLNPYGSETLSHIGTEALRQIIEDALGGNLDDPDTYAPNLQTFITSVVELVHQHPNNWNVKVFGGKKEVKVFEEDLVWRVRDFKDVLTRLPKSKYLDVFEELSKRSPSGAVTQMGDAYGSLLGKDENGDWYYVDDIEDPDKPGRPKMIVEDPFLPYNPYEDHLGYRVQAIKSMDMEDPDIAKEWKAPVKRALIAATMKMKKLSDDHRE